MGNNDELIAYKKLQQNEIDGSVTYKKIAQMVRDKDQRKILLAISDDELKHAKTFEKYTGITKKPRRLRVLLYIIIARLLGYTFIIKFLELDEDSGIDFYKNDIRQFPELEQILEDEERHEQQLIAMLDEERLKYLGDIVLGMNDALVELTGALAGYTLAMQNTHVISMAGLITGISATLSMASSGYLSSREAGSKNAGKSALYTGFAYLATVILLIVPYLILPVDGYLLALGITLVISIGIIAFFNFYVSISKDRPFGRNFLEMVGISMGVAAISFVVGIVVKNVLGIDL